MEADALNDCTCSTPSQWLELDCPVHHEEVRKRLELQGVALPEPAAEADAAEEAADQEPSTEVALGSYHRPLKSLSEQAERAAVLDAWGASRRQICAELGVQPSTVSWWRRSPVYIERYRAEKIIAFEALRDRFVADRTAALDGAEETRERLREWLDAADPDGNPLYGIRLEAAKLLMADKARTGEYDRGAEVKVDAKIAVGAVFHVHEDGKAEPAEAIVEGTVVAEEEVAEDGDR